MILFNSYGGRSFDDSPKALYDKIVIDKRFDDYLLNWAFLFPKKISLPRGKKIRINSLKYFLVALKSKYWITNVNIERGLHFKKKATVYLNTWHGTGPKKVGNSVKGRIDYDFSKTDFICADGQYLKNIFLRDFKAREENILMCGRPREDELFVLSPEIIEENKKKLGIPLNKKIILYAPTWRESDNSGESFSINIPVHIGFWKEKLGTDFILLFRAHQITTKILGIKFDDFCFDVSSVKNINLLYSVADILISDYSSVFADFSLLGRPMICFAYDYFDYINERGLYYDLQKVFKNGFCFSESEVIEKILHIDTEIERQKTLAFRDMFVERPKNATDYLIEKVFFEVHSK